MVQYNLGKLQSFRTNRERELNLDKDKTKVLKFIWNSNETQAEVAKWKFLGYLITFLKQNFCDGSTLPNIGSMS